MKKKWIGIGAAGGAAACIGAGLFVAFGIHRHEWMPATCVDPETCECGETRGEALGHAWTEATCTQASTCSVCGEQTGEALGHAWEEATCTLAATCSVCGETEGEALGHTWSEANYQTAATCQVCQETEGAPLTPWFEQQELSYVSEKNESCEYRTSTMDAAERKTVGHVVMTDFTVFDFDETHAAQEGYEWIAASFEMLFNDRNTWQHGCSLSWFSTDYYNPELHEESQYSLEEAEDETQGSPEESTPAGGSEGEKAEEGTAPEDAEGEAPEGEASGEEAADPDALGNWENYGPGTGIRYTVNYNGQDYDRCIAYCTTPEQRELQYATYIMTFDAYFRVPRGYDGTVLAFFDPAQGEEASGEEEPTEDGQAAEEQEKDGQKEENSQENGGEDGSQPEGGPEGEAGQETDGEEQELSAMDILAAGAAAIRLKAEPEAEESGFPRMTVLSGCIPVQPGSILESSGLIYGDADCSVGFYDLQKLAELGDYEAEQVWDQAPVYEEITLPGETSLLETLEIPAEEGVYQVKAAVRNGEGKAATAQLTLVVDGTKPDVHVPRNKVTLYSGDIFAPMEDVYGEDNFYGNEDCLITVNMEEYQKLGEMIQRGRAGTYKLTYYATDPAGNMGSRTISITLSAGGNQGSGSGWQPSAGQGSGGDGQQDSQDTGSDWGDWGDWGGGQQNVPEPQFMEDMAREALNLVNQYRADVGVDALAWNDSLYESAKIRAQELVISFSHTRPDGTSCFTAMSGFSTCAENIAWNYQSAASVCNGWYNSEGHRNNMLNPSLTQAAIACWYQDGSYYWVNLFGG